MKQSAASVWNIVLAAGEGSRMATLTRRLYGAELPKQFAAFAGDRTLLQQTMDRIAPLAPPERTVVVVSDQHEGIARTQLAEYTGVEIVPQPANVGTGNGVMLPLAHVLARDPRARVLVFPADHHFGRPERLVEGCRRALASADHAGDGLSVIGVPAEWADTDLGWIVPGDRVGPVAGGAQAITRFVEKPVEALARILHSTGGLWNTLVFGGRAAGLWRLCARYLPEQADLLTRYRRQIGRPNARALLRAIYQRLTPADFSREVLQKAGALAVVPVPDASWSDWGTPERLFAALEGTPHLKELLVRAAMTLDQRQGPARALLPGAFAAA